LSADAAAGSIRHRDFRKAAMKRLLALPLVALACGFLAAPARAEMIGGNPGPEHNYVCPHADGKPAIDCFLDAVQHLYTMCRNVKSIEIIEFGYENSTEGTNGAKSESCLDKQKQNIEHPFKAALKEAGKSKLAVEGLRKLHVLWLSAMNALAWHRGESDAEYKARVAKPYEEFSQRIALIRTSIESETKVATKKEAKPSSPKHAAKKAPEAATKKAPEAATKTAKATKD
jgi:hypothetical protein